MEIMIVTLLLNWGLSIKGVDFVNKEKWGRGCFNGNLKEYEQSGGIYIQLLFLGAINSTQWWIQNFLK